MALTRVRSQLITVPTNYPITGSLAGTASYATTASYALNGGTGGGGTLQTGSIAGQTILYNFSSSQEATITGLNLSNNKWGISVVEEWNSASIVGDVYYNSCSLLMHFSGSNGSTTFIDNSQNTLTVTSNNGAAISTAQSKFGSSSGYFDGTDDYLTIPSSTVFDFGSGDFTVEFWIKTTQTTSNVGLIVREWVSSPWSGGWVIQLNGNSNSAMTIYWADYSSSSPFMTANTTSYRDGNWHHIAWVRNGTSFNLYIDGISVATATSSTSFASVNKNITIGEDLTFGPRRYLGYMDELRVTKGIARYTGSFTTQSAEFLNYGTLNQYETKYIGLIGGLNDTGSDYGVQKLNDTSLKIRKMSVSGTPVSGSPILSSSVDRVYVNVLNYDNVAITSSSVTYGVLLNNLYDNVLLTYERKNEQIVSISSTDYGTQADGAITISTAKNISSDTLAASRTYADGISYPVTAITSNFNNSVITVSGSSINGISSGDEILLINLQGDTTYYSNVGNYELLRVLSISTNNITCTNLITKTYGESTNSSLGNQKVIIQRVPNYSTVTVTSGGTLTCNNWSGSSGGILAFKCDTLVNSGSIHTNGKGFRYGVGGIRNDGAGCTNYPSPSPTGDRGESYRGLNSVALCSRLTESEITSIGGGGGGGGGIVNTTNRSGGGGGGGANRTNGTSGSNSPFGVNKGAAGGSLYNTNTDKLIFGGGGGGGGRACNAYGGDGGSGGGIVLIYANNFNNNAVINATGSRGNNGYVSDDGGGGGGGGGGGVILIKSNYVNSVGTFSIAGGAGSSGGAGSLYGTGGAGGAGGLGNQLLKYTTANVSVSSVTASFESSSISVIQSAYPNIEDGFVDNFYAYNTLYSATTSSWDSVNKSYYNVTGSVGVLTSYPVTTISSSVIYPTVVRAVLFAENNDDDPWTINRDLKFYLSNNGGISYTTASLVKRGLYESGKFIYSNDVNLTNSNTSSLTYKLEFSSSKLINVYGVGLVWPIDLTVISSSVTASFALTSSYALNSSAGESFHPFLLA